MTMMRPRDPLGRREDPEEGIAGKDAEKADLGNMTESRLHSEMNTQMNSKAKIFKMAREGPGGGSGIFRTLK